ncbi:serine/threonine-protein kinase [Boudabousia marimammalium]|uniref:non-specific serine/threonine protein kinase n=1 Tax=Boudabousia marimammalium TaxID=156892 RepID=A0A1Q5PSI7_9ACTO|nr:serine/threonine-protein kinase [Boudabousia marimammalium]OKL50548.1 hypothetical protein BM477_00840 [Boudabousia marimammalium]
MIHKGAVYGGRYELTDHIAVGGMGEVWKAHDRLRDREVAIKVLRDDLAGDKHFLQRLAIEAQNAQRMKHPNLAAVLDHGEDNQVGWLVMELVEGYPLVDYVANGHTLTVEQLLPLLYQVALALTAVHAAGVVHRDIKPGNFLIDTAGHLKLTDFGISRAAQQADLTEVGMVMGTAQYLPPEQAKGEVATPLGDLYSVGIIAYEALVGHRPFTGETQVDIAIAHVNQKVPPLPETIPALMRTLVMSLLQKNPANRPKDAIAFARQVAYVAQQLEVSLQPVPLGPPDAEQLATPKVTPPAANASSAQPPRPASETVQAASQQSASGAKSAEPAARRVVRKTVATKPAPAQSTVLDPVQSSEWHHFEQSWDSLVSEENTDLPEDSAGAHNFADAPAKERKSDHVTTSFTLKNGNLTQNSPLWLLAVIVLVLIIIAVLMQFGLHTLSYSGSYIQEMEGTLWLNHALSV